MSESPPPVVAGGAAGDAQKALTQEQVEAVLADFRAWLEQAVSGAELAEPSPREAPPDLYTLLGELIALRQEVNLQTRAARNQQEQNAEALRQLSEALAVLRDRPAETGETSSAEECQRPLLKTLIDVYDALSLGRRELQRLQPNVLDALERLQDRKQSAAPAGEHGGLTPRRSPGLLSRLFGGHAPVTAGPDAVSSDAGPAADHARRLLDALITGYTMSLQRLERALQQHGLEPIPCVGRPFDPEQMEVAEVVTATDRPGGEVLEELRRGYRWRGRVFRFVQVRVAKPS
jgi:molecular chaperone GrpE